MFLDWILLALVALGHLCVLVLLVNMAHALGVSLKRADVLTLAILLIGLILPSGLLISGAGVSRFSWPWPFQAYALVCLGVAGVGLPATTVARWRRRQPARVAERSEVAAWIERADQDRYIGPGVHSWMLRLPGNHWRQLRRVECHVAVPGLPPACQGLSIVQLSDLHFARCFQCAYFDAIAEAASQWEADLFVFTGDLIDDEACIAWIEPVLSRLRGRLGNFAILGNHDYSFDTEAIRRAIERAGFLDVDGRWTSLDVAGARLAIGGTSAPWGPRIDLGGMAEADLRILLSHSPDLFYRATKHRIDLMLSGHNHGGQVRLPVVGPVLMPSRYSRRFDRGFFCDRWTLLYVSQGISGKHPIRYGCPPELTRFVLHPSVWPEREESALGDLKSSGVVRVEADVFSRQVACPEPD
jgi:predicted MPP superfamily phosphohydrolase